MTRDGPGRFDRQCRRRLRIYVQLLRGSDQDPAHLARTNRQDVLGAGRAADARRQRRSAARQRHRARRARPGVRCGDRPVDLHGADHAGRHDARRPVRDAADRRRIRRPREHGRPVDGAVFVSDRREAVWIDGAPPAARDSAGAFRPARRKGPRPRAHLQSAIPREAADYGQPRLNAGLQHRRGGRHTRRPPRLFAPRPYQAGQDARRTAPLLQSRRAEGIAASRRPFGKRTESLRRTVDA